MQITARQAARLLTEHRFQELPQLSDLLNGPAPIRAPARQPALHRDVCTCCMSMLLRTTLAWALFVLVVSVPAADARGLRMGFFDAVFTAPAAEREPWLARAVKSGSDIVRLNSGWGAIAPTRPRAPTDPADPAYSWQSLDDAVKAADARGLEVIISLTGAPAWAAGRRPPAGISPFAWRPQAKSYGPFARALAKRFSGSYPDPGRPGAMLPRVRYYLPWNEPNLDVFLAPQWVKRDGRFRAASPAIYRSLLNEFARGVKSVSRRNKVIAGATAPFGDVPGGGRMEAVTFVRALLRRRTVFDVLSHHPYSTHGPRAPAYSPNNVTVPDFGKLRRPLRAAERAGRIVPRGRKRMWVTEVAWDSSPPDPQGVPRRRHARWLQEAMYVLWRQGVDTVLWFQIRDQAPEPSFAATYQSGVYFRDGRPKLTQRAFAFPFVATRRPRGEVRVWTRAPARGTLLFEARSGRGWRTIRRVAVRRHQVVERRLRVGRRAQLRARMGKLTSLASRG